MRTAVAACLFLGCGLPTALAQQQGVTQNGSSAQSQDTSEEVRLEGYFAAMDERRLVSREDGSIRQLQDLVSRAEGQYFQGSIDEAALLLYEAVESPRFSDFQGLDVFANAEFRLASALIETGALNTARRYLGRVLARGPGPYFAPAYRRYVDAVLASGNLAHGAAELGSLSTSDSIDRLPEDAANELRYLKARSFYDEGDAAKAAPLFSAITKKSRFYANSRYFLGAIAADKGNLKRAEARFCSIAKTGDRERYTFYVDDRYFEIKDLAWLALGRIAHEGKRSDDAFYYYFQVPNDSERVAEAMFESAYAMYEGGDNDTAVDLLDQLEARFPTSPFVQEASLLRGYVHLSRCEFEQASRQFRAYRAQFLPVLREVRRIAQSPARQEQLYVDLLRIEQAERATQATAQSDGSTARAIGEARPADAPRATTEELLLGLMRVDPDFYALHARVRTLDAEAARAGRLSVDLNQIASRLRGRDRPQAASASEDAYDASGRHEIEELQRDLAEARAVARSLTDQIDTLRKGGAPASEVRALEKDVRAASQRIEQIERQFSSSESGVSSVEETGERASGIETMIASDIEHVQALPGRARAVRMRLVAAANEQAQSAIEELEARLASGMRRARIGRIDAVMGSKRRIEIQIESLAAGRFPAELRNPLQIQGLLRDDEEYWPFEGEYWSDEFDETVPLEALETDR